MEISRITAVSAMRRWAYLFGQRRPDGQMAATSDQRDITMILNPAFRALMFSAALAICTPAVALAAPANTGSAAEAFGTPFAQPMTVTCGSTAMAANTGNAARPAGDLLSVQPVAQMNAANGGTRAGNGASALGGFGTEVRG
jgi:hypothetical protein